VSWVRAPPGRATRWIWAVSPKRVAISIEPSGSQSSNTAERAL
jgi:hypothetical protein